MKKKVIPIAVDEVVRAHAKLSASGADKWATCTMAPAMEAGLPDELSEFNREGTCAHAVGERRLAVWLDDPRVVTYTVRLGQRVKLVVPENEAEIPDYDEFFDEAFDDHVQDYVDFVIAKITALREQHGEANVVVLLEQRLDFSRWVPEGFGTGDVVIIVPGSVVVIDLKFGQGVYVSGEDNSQLKLYGLGAWARYDILYDFDTVEVIIHQPRKDNVSGEVIDVRDIGGLLTWADEFIVPRAAIAWEGLHGDRTRARFHPGSHCSSGFCKARFNCAARARFELELGDLPHVLNAPDTLTIDQLEGLVGRAEGVAKWVADCKRYLLSQAEQGLATLKRFRLGEGRSNRRITDVMQAAAALMAEGFEAKSIYKDPKLRGFGELEALVGKKNLPGIIGEWITKPAGKTTLVPVESAAKAVDPTKRSADEDFGE